MLTPLVDAYKIASGDNAFLPLLERRRPPASRWCVSTGASDLDEAVARGGPRPRATGRRADHDGDLAVLHCVSALSGAARGSATSRDPAARRTSSTPPSAIPITCSASRPRLRPWRSARASSKSTSRSTSTTRLSRSPAVGRSRRDARAGRARPGGRADARRRRERRCSLREANVPAIRRSIAAAADLRRRPRAAAADLIWLRPGDRPAPGRGARADRTALRPRGAAASRSRRATSSNHVHVRHRRLRRHARIDDRARSTCLAALRTARPGRAA